MKTFFVGIKGVIVRDGKVLLVRTDPEHESRGARWEMPGGRMEANESIDDALRRELQEEVPNIQNIQVHEILGAHRVHKDIKDSHGLILIYFRVEATFPGDPALSEEHLEWKWADEAMVKELIPDASQPTILKAL